MSPLRYPLSRTGRAGIQNGDWRRRRIGSLYGRFQRQSVKGYATLGDYEFDNTLTEGIVRYEYNFWAFGTGREYRGARKLVPFITLGLGIVHHSGENSGITMSMPIGAGIKYKVSQRLNFTAEWALRFTPSDHLDGRKDVYGIKSSGLFKNTDCYNVLQLSLSYDVWMKCKTCHNDRD